MCRLTDQEYLLNEQYQDASNLNARIRFHKRFSTNEYGWMRWVFDRLVSLPPESRILELGCGPGDLWRDNGYRIPASWDITLSDFSPGMVAQARQNLAGLQPEFRFDVVDAQDIPFESEGFEAVVANHMLFFVPDRPLALAEIHRLLKPGGRLFATTVGRNHLWEMGELLASVDPGADQRSAAVEFGLENGLEQLRPFFAQVRVHRYEDALEVTEVEPLLNYVLSSGRSTRLRADPAPFVELATRKIKNEGALHITKVVGLFEATKSPSNLKSQGNSGWSS